MFGLGLSLDKKNPNSRQFFRIDYWGNYLVPQKPELHYHIGSRNTHFTMY